MDTNRGIEEYLVSEGIPSAKYDSHSRKVAEELLNFVRHKNWQEKTVEFIYENMFIRYRNDPGWAYTAFFEKNNVLLFEVISQWPKGEVVKIHYDNS